MTDAIYGLLSYLKLSYYLKNLGSKELKVLRWSDTGGKILEINYQLVDLKAS